MVSYRIRIGAGIAISLGISFVLMRYTTLGVRPEFNTELMLEEAQALPLTMKTALANVAPRISFPAGISTGIFSQAAPSPTPVIPAGQPPPNTDMPPAGSSSSTVPFSTPVPLPTTPPPIARPTTPGNPPPLPPSSSSSSKAPPPAATSVPKPTKQPKPTKVPKPTKAPKLTLEARRPGNSFQEVMETLSPIMCVPVPLMHATLENEYGPWLSKIEAEWDSKNTMQGSDTTAVSGSQTIIGVTQMMSDTWYRIKTYVMDKFTVNDMSLIVTFDSIAASAYHQRNVSLAGQNHQPCDDWDVKYILYAACRYNGACPPNTMGQTQYYNDYTYKVCEAYNRYTTGPQKKCR